MSETIITLTSSPSEVLAFVKEAIESLKEIQQTYLELGFTREVAGYITVESKGDLYFTRNIPFSYEPEPSYTILELNPDSVVAEDMLPTEIRRFGDVLKLVYQEEPSYAV